jgi:TPR repeat protein
MTIRINRLVLLGPLLLSALSVKILAQSTDSNPSEQPEKFQDPCREYSKGVDAYGSRNHALALKLLLPCADAGNPKAQAIIGDLYEIGIDVPHDDEKAVKYYKLAAESGVASAQADLASHYLSGKGVMANYAEAIRLFRSAAEKGNQGAQELLGLAYEHGWWGLSPDAKESKYWTDLSRKPR